MGFFIQIEADSRSSEVATTTASAAIDDKPNQPEQKSQRFLDMEEIEADLKVPKSMQDFLYKKLSKKIDDSVDFIDIKEKPTKKKEKTKKVTSVKLLKDTEPIKYLDVVEADVADWVKPTKRMKLDVKQKIIEPDPYDENEKLRMASIDGRQILEKADTKAWKPRKNAEKKLFHYKEKNAALYLIERDNEFSTARRKNNWDESKIARKKTK